MKSGVYFLSKKKTAKNAAYGHATPRVLNEREGVPGTPPPPRRDGSDPTDPTSCKFFFWPKARSAKGKGKKFFGALKKAQKIFLCTFLLKNWSKCKPKVFIFPTGNFSGFPGEVPDPPVRRGKGEVWTPSSLSENHCSLNTLTLPLRCVFVRTYHSSNIGRLQE